jgi:hypothetical protein
MITSITPRKDTNFLNSNRWQPGLSIYLAILAFAFRASRVGASQLGATGALQVGATGALQVGAGALHVGAGCSQT